MTGWLLDTNILSLFAPAKDGISRVDTKLADWVRERSDHLFLSAISITETTTGIESLRRAGAVRRADDLQVWIDRILSLYQERSLPVDVTVARCAGRLADHAKATGRHPGLADLLIAATAQSHDLVLLTRNTRHFTTLGLTVAILDPLDSAADL